jgi:hypothetical protein
MLINRTFILSYLPASAMMGDANQYLPFVDLFDVNALRRAYGPNCCASPDEIDESVRNHTRTEHDYERLLREFRENSSNLTANKHIQVCGAPYHYVIKANITSVYENTQPHPSLKKMIHSAVDRLSNAIPINTTSHSHKKAQIICMHLRTETDFMYFFGHAPAAYTREQILAKMNLTRTKHPHTTFAKLWSQNKDLEIKPVLYLAGGDKSDAKRYFIKTGWFSTVEDKHSVFSSSNQKNISFTQLLVQYNAPSSLLSSLRFEVSTVLAIIDTEICKAADIFIGNNHSSLSERIASERQRSTRWEGNANRTLENGGKYNYMVNALSNDASTWEDFSKLEPLHPFCAANSEIFMSYKCNYVRSPV